MAMIPDAPSHIQAPEYVREKIAEKFFGSTMIATSITSNVPTTSLTMFILATDIDLPAFVKGKAQIAQQILARNAINEPVNEALNTY